MVTKSPAAGSLLFISLVLSLSLVYTLSDVQQSPVAQVGMLSVCFGGGESKHLRSGSTDESCE